jgi:hypothetical protein
MSAPTASCLPSTKAKEAMKYVIGTVLDFNPVDDCPLWLALIHDATDKSRVNLYNQWLWLTLDDILTLEYHPDLSKQKEVPLSRGYHTHVTRFKAMYSELQRTPGWIDLDIFKTTYDEYMAFSREYMAGQVASNLLSQAPNLYASSTDPVTLFTKSIKQEPKDFPVIKLLNQWDSVKRVVNATATVQLIAELLNHTYIPSVGDKPLFDLKNSYWYKVLVDIIQESSPGHCQCGSCWRWTNCLDKHHYRGQKVYDGLYFITITHCLPHHFQDSRWLLAGYRHCVS